MSKQGEVHVDLSEEQWAMVKAALEGEIADVRAENARLQERVEEAEHRLTQAQENLDWARKQAISDQQKVTNAERHAKRLNTLHNAEKAERDEWKALVARRGSCSTHRTWRPSRRMPCFFAGTSPSNARRIPASACPCAPAT